MKRILSKFIHLVKHFQYEFFLGSCIILIAVISYNLGQINLFKKTPISIKESTNLGADIFNAANSKSEIRSTKQIQNKKSEIKKLDTRVVVSKNSDRYHYTWCSGTKRIKPDNQVWFNSAIEAESRGYILAGNCQQ